METFNKRISEIIKEQENCEFGVCSFPVSIVPTYKGINLCSVDSITWQKQDDGQIVNVLIHFLPNEDGSQFSVGWPNYNSNVVYGNTDKEKALWKEVFFNVNQTILTDEHVLQNLTDNEKTYRKLINYITDNDNLLVTNLPTFVFKGTEYHHKTWGFANYDEIISFFNKMKDKIILIYGVFISTDKLFIKMALIEQ